jgi:hypothetical protein
MLLCVPAMAQGDETEIEEPSGEPIEDEPPPPPAPKPDEGKVVPKAPLQARINAAIEKGVVWLKERQGKDGSYGPCIASHRYDSDEESDLALYYIGPTAFAVFTLRKCGVPRTDRTIKKSLKWLKKVCRKGWTPGSKRIDGTQFQGKGTYLYSSYESSAVIMMLVALNKKDVKRGQKPKPVKMSRSPGTPMSGFKKDEWMWMHERIQFLIDNPHNRMPSVQIRGGGWRYWPPYKKADQDLSATQFALLGLRAAVMGVGGRGGPVPPTGERRVQLPEDDAVDGRHDRGRNRLHAHLQGADHEHGSDSAGLDGERRRARLRVPGQAPRLHEEHLRAGQK